MIRESGAHLWPEADKIMPLSAIDGLPLAIKILEGGFDYICRWASYYFGQRAHASTVVVARNIAGLELVAGGKTPMPGG